MKTFRDTAGQEWTIALTIGAAKRLRDLAGIDLLALDAGDPPLATRLTTDVILAVDALFVAIKPQADALGVTDEQFGERLGGTAAKDGLAALFEEMADFYQSLGRGDLARGITTQRTIMLQATERAEKALERATPAILKATADRQTADLESAIAGATSGNSPPRPALTPDPSPSAN